jgi:hypothetical protein
LLPKQGRFILNVISDLTITADSYVSYIVIMEKKISIKYKGFFCDYDYQNDTSRIFDILCNDITNNGEIIFNQSQKVYYKTFTFKKNSESMFFRRTLSKYDFSVMDEKELIKFIYGEYFIHKKIDTIEGFSIMEIPYLSHNNSNDYMLKHNRKGKNTPLQKMIFFKYFS